MHRQRVRIQQGNQANDQRQFTNVTGCSMFVYNILLYVYVLCSTRILVQVLHGTPAEATAYELRYASPAVHRRLAAGSAECPPWTWELAPWTMA